MLTDLTSYKVRFFTTRPGDLKCCVLGQLRWEQPNLQISAQYGDFRFWPIWGHQKSDFSKVVPDTSNCAFCFTYAERSVSCKFELNTEILDFDWFEVCKNPIFHNSSRQPQMLRFVLVTLKAALPANLSLIGRFKILTDWRSPTIRFFITRPGDLKWCVLCKLRWKQAILQIGAQYGDFRFLPISGHQKSDFQ